MQTDASGILDLNPVDESVTATTSLSQTLSNQYSRLELCTTEELMQIVLNSPEDKILRCVPEGPKNNARFVVDNTQNFERYKQSQRMEFWDDCGAWVSSCSTSTKTYYIKTSESGSLRSIRKHKNVYGLPKKVKRKIIWIPMDPQPKEEDLVILHRYYSVLKADTNYKKRVSWFEFPGMDNVRPIAIYEYSGEYTPAARIAHGNCKTVVEKKPYVRSKPSMVRKVKRRLKTDSPAKIFEQMTSEAGDDATLAPNHLKQIRQLKYTMNRVPKVPQRPTVPDDVLQLSNMVRKHPYVQQYVQSKDRLPQLILYTDDQMKDLKSFLAAESYHVVGIDRLPSDGPYMVTVVFYRNLKVLNASTHTHPIVLGPVFVHSDSTIYSYNSFFGQLVNRMTPAPAGFEVNIRTDEDGVIGKALDSNFPGVEQFFCTQPLASTVTSYLRDDLGMLPTDIDTIVMEIFGDHGLVKINNETEFEKKCATLITATENVYPLFVEYFCQRLKPLLLDNIRRPFAGNAFRNNSQAINNYLQLSINWKINRASALVEGLYEVIEQQMKELVDSLTGQGSYSLVPQYKKFAVTSSAWADMTQEEKDAHVQRFLSA